MVAGNGNVVGVVDPGVALLRYNGGPTRNLALLPASPALDAGGDALAVDAAGNPLTTDQRGPDFQRVYGGRVDIGAFEAQPIAPLTEAGLQPLLAAADSVTIYANSLTTPDLVAQLVSALGGLTRPTTITLDMEGDPYSTGGITYNPGDPLTAVNLTFVVQNGTLESTGSAVTISGGQATVQNCTLITTGNSPTVVVAGGSLNLWSNTVQESTTAANAALSMTGGTVATDSNVFHVNGAGQFVQNTTANPVSPFLDMFLVNGAAPPLIPLTITLTNTGDSGPGSLRQAVLDATFQGIVDVGRPTIAFAIPTTDPGYDATTGKHTITLTDGAVIIGYGMIIDGPGASTLTVSSNHASPIFEIYGVFSSGVTVSVADLTIENALGGIFNFGALTVSNCTFSDNAAYLGGGGGGIRNYFGTLTVIDSSFSGNTAYSGGGISNDSGTVTVSGSTFVGNTADFSGGGIDNIAGTLTISNSTFSGNSAVETGGGISNAGTLTVSGSTFTGNTAAQRGGGIYNQDGALTIANSTFTGNAAQGTSGEGGGIYGVDGTLTVIGSAFTGNSAGFGGAIRSHSGGGPAGLLVSGSTFSGNLATGAPGGAGLYSSRVRINNTVETSYLYITNSTFHGNVATGVSGGVRIQVAGTGPNSSVPTEIVNSTIVGNSAINGGALLPSASYPA